MAKVGDILKFETFNFKGMKKQIGHDPWRLLIGSGDRYSTSMWNKILGRHDDPIVDQFGGAASQRYGEAEKAGIDTTAGRNMHSVARVIALYNAGGAGANAAGGGGAAGAGGEGAAGAAEGGTALGGDLGYGGVTTGAPTLGGGSSVAIDSGVSAGGAGSAGSTGSVPASTTGGSSVSNWVRMAQQFGAGQQQPQKQELDQEEPDLRYDPNAYLQYSSKTVKTRADDVPNVDLTNPIDRNGAEILAIQELSKEIEAVSKRVAQLKRAKTRIAT